MPKNLKQQYYPEYISFLSSFIWGFLAHGYMIANKITSHDDLGVLYSTGAGIYNGRWMTGWFSNFGLMNTSWFNGIMVLILLSASASLIVNAFKIKSTLLAACVGACISTYPVVTSTLLYMFTSVAYMCGFLLAVIAAWIILTKKHWIILQIGVIGIIFSMGFYQAYFPVTASLLLIGLFQYYNSNRNNLSDMLKTSIKDFILLLEGLAGYIITQKVLLWVYNIEMPSYQGMNHFGTINFSELPLQIQNAYSNFFSFYGKIFPQNPIYERIDLLISTLFVCACTYYIIKSIFLKKWIAAIFNLLISILFPLSCNLVHLYGADGVHTLMQFGNVCVLLLIIVTLQDINNKKYSVCVKKVTAIICCILTISLSTINCNLANTVYLTQEHAVRNTILYCNRMIERIQSLPEYSPDMAVCVVGRYVDETVNRSDSDFRRPEITGFDSMGMLLNTVLYQDWCQEAFFRIYLGFGQSFLKEPDRRIISESPDVQVMPDYPADGSVAIIDNVIIVHLSN